MSAALPSVDLLIDTIVSDAMTDSGLPIQWRQAQGALTRGRIAAPNIHMRPARWTEQEDAFYLANVGRLSMAEIGAALGRTENAVKIHATRKRLPMPTKVPGFLTTHQVAVILGVDSHKPPVWVDEGILPGEQIPGERAMRRISITRFKMWLVRPESWVYFNVRRIKVRAYRRLVELAQAKWNDAWWTTRQAADALGTNPSGVLHQIAAGKLAGYQARVMGGRHVDQSWAYWYVRRSHVLGLSFHGGKGRPAYDRLAEECGWTARADAFLLEAHRAGKTWAEIGRMMKKPEKQVGYRGRMLLKRSPGIMSRRIDER